MSAPGEEDLQDLYNQVWAYYTNDERDQQPVTNSADLDTLYAAYSNDLPNPHTPIEQPQRPTGLPTSPRDGRPLPNPAAHAIPPSSSNPASPQARNPRPLPRPPGASAPAPSMPEPRPYSPGAGATGRGSNGKHSSGDSTARRLPDAPSPTTTHRSRPTTAGSAATSSPAQVFAMPVPEISAPATQQQDSNGYWANGVSTEAYEAQYPARTSSMNAGGAYGGGYGASLGRNTSTGSSSSYATSSNAHLYRNTSLASSNMTTPYTPGASSYLEASSSSFATTVDRGDSFRSYSSSTGAPVLPVLTHQASFAISDTMRTPPAPGQAGPSTDIRRPSGFEDTIATLKQQLGLQDDEELYSEGESEGADDDRFINFALLSHLAVRLRDNVPRGTHVKENIPYPRAFTGKDVVSTIQAQIQRELLITHGISTSDRRVALQVARSMQSQLFFFEVEWGGRLLQDSVEDVFMFLDDMEGMSDARGGEREELPTAVVTMLTRCYSITCTDVDPCYAYACPRRKDHRLLAGVAPSGTVVAPAAKGQEDWEKVVDPVVLTTLPVSERKRQDIIYKIINKERAYIQDLDTIDSLFIRGLRRGLPSTGAPIMPPEQLEAFIDDVFHNVLDLRECNRRLMEDLSVRQREQGPVIQEIGDVFLAAASEFRLAYPAYVGHLPLSEKRLKEETDANANLRMFFEHCARQPESRQLNLKTFLTRPSEHLQKYPVLLEAILNETAEGNQDAVFLREAIHAIRNLQNGAQLLTFQAAMGRGPTGKLQWFDMVGEEVRTAVGKDEMKRQSIMFELISGEMTYVRDLENIDVMYVQPLITANPPIIPPQRLKSFITDVFHNYAQLLSYHRRLLERLHQIQQEEHPLLNSITAALLDAFLNWRDAYLEYVPNYPIAAYRIAEERANNPQFKAFHDAAVRHPEANRKDMKDFVNRPIPRMLRYSLLMESVLKETPEGHEDRAAIPQLLEVIKSLGKETEPGVASAEQKVKLWEYNAHLVFKPGEAVDMDLLDENRALIYAGKLLRQPDTGFEWSGWSELFCLLFDNYFVMTKPKEKDGITKYHVSRRPIPLDLLTLATFSDPPTQRSTGILRGLRGGDKHGGSAGGGPDMINGPYVASPESANDSRAVYPCTIHYNGRLGGLLTLYSESANSRSEWKTKLNEAIGIRKVVQESNKVFEVETLSSETFLVPSLAPGPSGPAFNGNDSQFTGKVTCSIPFNTSDGRALMAIGCAEGVWIGFRHDPRSLRRVLHLKMVTQCAMLDDFGIFLVLADKSLFAYHIEALVPSTTQNAHMSQTPQKLSGSKDVHFFTVGQLNGRTLVIYMRKKGLDSVFRVLEPVVGHIGNQTKAPTSRWLRSQRSDWFRMYREFFLPSESYDLIFLKAKIAVLCTKGFEIMDLTDFKSVTIPQRDDPRLEKLAKRCDTCRPMGMFRSNADEFLLCYDEFGLYVDRHGDPSRSTSTIEWEGTAERVAWHQPYVLLFDSRFIEIRHVETGRLAQIIPGNDVRCIWDGRGAKTAPMPTPGGVDGWNPDSGGYDQEARVHAVMTAPDTPGHSRPRGAQAQHVFELIPTIPLFLPGALSSPDQSATYFSQGGSMSPPQSPRQSVAGGSSWR